MHGRFSGPLGSIDSNEAERRPWRYWCWFRRIDELCWLLPRVCSSNVLHEANRVVDMLAKGGVEPASWFWRVLPI
ncbi:hypothetical protein GQ457_02G034490 [Hibiscus cannabinus]